MVSPTTRSDVFILDEPTAALDARSEYEVFRRFRDLSRGQNGPPYLASLFNVENGGSHSGAGEQTSY